MLEEFEHLEDVRIYCAELKVLCEFWFAWGFMSTKSDSNKSRSAAVSSNTLERFCDTRPL